MSYLIVALALGPPLTSYFRDRYFSRASHAHEPESGRVMAYACLITAFLLAALGAMEFGFAVAGVIRRPTQPAAFRQHLADALVAYIGVGFNLATFRDWRIGAKKP